MFRHILPNVLPIAFATMLLNIAFALVAMSALSFLGLGVGPGEPDWGRQLADGRDLLSQNAAAVIVPGVLIIVDGGHDQPARATGCRSTSTVGLGVG